MANGIQKDLGKVTAYSYAKAAGYTGTEEQFQAIFNEFTENAPGLMDRMDTAVERAEAAVTNIDATVQDAVDAAVEEATASAVATANQAVTDAQAAQTAAEGAVTQANNAVTQANAAVTAAQAAQSAAEDAAESFVLDRTLTDSGAAAPADLVGGLKESLMGDGTLNLDKSDVRNAYPSKTVGSALTFTNSSVSVSYNKIIHVEEGQKYTISVTNSATPASDGSRDGVVVDGGNIVRSTFKLATTAGGTNTVEITPSVDGWLVLCVDKNYVDISIKGYTVQNDLAELRNWKKDKCLFEKTYEVPPSKSTVMSPDIQFKAGYTYVVVLYSPNYGDGRKFEFGVSGTDFSCIAEFVDHYSVVKYRPNADTTTHFWAYSTVSNSRTINVWCEEWSKFDEISVMPPDTIIVSASGSVWRDKYISKYIGDWEDDTPIIQQAINDLPPKGGEVILCDGNYVIGSLTDTEDEEVGLIGIEITNPTTKHFVSLRGMSKPIRVSDHEMGLGATLFVKAAMIAELSATQHVTIIGARPTDSEYLREPRALNLSIKNIAINIPTNQKPIKCIDLEYISAAEIENVVIGISGQSAISNDPDMGCIGIRGLGGWNYGIYYLMRCVKVFGVGIGFDLGGEHLLMEQCATRYCGMSYRFYKYGDVTKMSHPQTLINCCEEHCKKSILFGSNANHPQVTLIDYNFELRNVQDSGKWARTQAALEETAGDINGEITFTINKEDYENIADVDFWESGSGLNIITRNSVDKKYGATASRPTNPNLMQQYYDTTLSKLILFDGTNWVDTNGTTV